MSADHGNTYLKWAPPGKSLVVHLEYSVIERMTVDVMRGFGVTRRRGTEAGGLLIGRIDRRAQPVIHIREYEAVPCEYASGPSYLLSDNDVERFQAAIARWRPSLDQDLYAVGYFRSHTRDGFAMDGNDASLFREFFRDPLDVALLIKPFATRTPVAGFFVQEKGALVMPAGLSEFPFASPGKPGKEEPPPDLERPSPPPAPPTPPPSPPPPPPVAPAKPKPEYPPLPPAPVYERPMFMASQPEPSALKRRLSWIVFCLALLAFGGAVGYEYAGMQAQRRLPDSLSGADGRSPSAGHSPYSINLQVTQSDSSLMLKWDRDAAAIQAAQRGVLTVTEGTNSKEVNLSASELRNGTALYPQVAPVVRFRLELIFADNRTFVESIEFRQQVGAAE